MNNNLLALYIHIPFCITRCNYCSFISSVFNSTLAEKYINALKKEIEINSKNFSNKQLASIYIGGGTPSVLKEKAIEEIMNSILSNFILNNNIEITIEANPGTITENKLKTYKNIGINRLSIGVQTFELHLLKILGRSHSIDDISRSYYMTKESGFDNINLDLLFAIPSQTLENWQNTLKKTIELHPSHISTYNLIYERGTNFTLNLRKGKIKPVNNDMEFKMYRYVINFFKKNGYNQYEISNFSLKDKQCQHNLLYWKNNEYLGIGAGAVSYINGIRYSNTKNIIKYIEKINEGVKPVTFKEHILKEKQMKENAMLSLRLMKGLDKIKFKAHFGISVEDIWGDAIKKLEAQKLVKNNMKYLKLTRQGVYLNNEVLVEFM